MDPRHKPLSYTSKEKVQLINSSLFIGIVLFLFAWRVVDLNLVNGILFLVGYVIVALLSLLVFSGISKIVGHRRGFFVHYSRWKSGQIFGIVLSIITTGFVPFLFAGINDIEANKRVRHGKVFPGENKKDITVISFAGIVGLLFFSVFLRIIDRAINTPFTEFAAIGVAILALVSLAPLPKCQGGVVFYVNKKNYVISSVILVLVSLMVIANTVIYVLLVLLVLVIAVFIIRKVKRT